MCIRDRISNLQSSFDEQKKALDKANADLTKAQDDLKKANETIENLKKAPAEETTENPQDNNEETDFLTNAVNQYNRIKDI